LPGFINLVYLAAMNTAGLSIREMQVSDIPRIADYWLHAEAPFLLGMGVDVNKLPSREQLTNTLTEQIKKPIETKRAFCLIWLMDEQPVGHTNTNPTWYGKEAYMHLHIWKTDLRQKGLGAAFIQLSLPVYFEKLRLKKLYCEPYALNPAPNKTIEKAGFVLEKEYITIPGSLNFEQPVKRWVLTLEKLKQLYPAP
jgi:RimJ/RimL family protein N-acetyltransferase